MLPSGQYYIGDLCYVIADWDKFCDQTLSGETVIEGEMIFLGTPIASYCTMWGDGLYTDEDGNEYPVDAGLIGCIPMSAVTKPDGVKHGRVVDFPDNFRTYSKDGVISFGERRRPNYGRSDNSVVNINTAD